MFTDETLTQLKVIDFGSTSTCGTAHETMYKRTTGFVAPEALEGDCYTPQSDMWALGATFFALMTGHYVHAAGDCNVAAIAKGLRKLDAIPKCPKITKVLTNLLAWKE